MLVWISEGAYNQAPMRSLLTWSVGMEGHPENESTDRFEGVRLSRSHLCWLPTETEEQPLY